MTDNEIIKALECCMGCFCKGCPYYDENADVEDRDCMGTLVVNALNLINRQKAEIERLKKHNTEMARKHYEDGIKEFAERLKDSSCIRYVDEMTGEVYQMIISGSTIDHLVKEMTEGA